MSANPSLTYSRGSKPRPFGGWGLRPGLSQLRGALRWSLPASRCERARGASVACHDVCSVVVVSVASSPSPSPCLGFVLPCRDVETFSPTEGRGRRSWTPPTLFCGRPMVSVRFGRLRFPPSAALDCLLRPLLSTSRRRMRPPGG